MNCKNNNMETKNGLINYSFFSKFLTGNRTQLTQSYDKKKYINEVKYISKLERDWKNGIRFYEFDSSDKENFIHNYPKNSKISVGIKVNIKSREILKLYVYVQKKFTFMLDQFTQISWDGNTIQKIEINFPEMIIKFI